MWLGCEWDFAFVVIVVVAVVVVVVAVVDCGGVAVFAVVLFCYRLLRSPHQNPALLLKSGDAPPPHPPRECAAVVS